MSISKVPLFSSWRVYVLLIKFIPGYCIMLLLLQIGSFISFYFPLGCFSCTDMVLVFLYLTYVLVPY